MSTDWDYVYLQQTSSDLRQEAQIKRTKRGHVDEFCSVESLNAHAGEFDLMTHEGPPRPLANGRNVFLNR